MFAFIKKELLTELQRTCNKSHDFWLYRCKNPRNGCRQCQNENRRGRHFRTSYGITRKQYQELLDNQSGRCEICNELPCGRKLAIDHCHSTKIVRGLLCGSCNRGLGMFRDSPELLVEAKQYLERTKETN